MSLASSCTIAEISQGQTSSNHDDTSSLRVRLRSDLFQNNIHDLLLLCQDTSPVSGWLRGRKSEIDSRWKEIFLGFSVMSRTSLWPICLIYNVTSGLFLWVKDGKSMKLNTAQFSIEVGTSSRNVTYAKEYASS